jgi:chorismate mutase
MNMLSNSDIAVFCYYQRMQKSNPDIVALRRRIDILDKAIVASLAERMRAIRQVGEYKRRHNLPPLDKKRWQAVLADRTKRGIAAGLPASLVRKVYASPRA